MKRFAIILLAVLLFTSFAPNHAIALSPPNRIDFNYCVHSTFNDGFLVDTDYLKSVGCTPSRYGTGGVPLVLETREEYDLVFPYGPTYIMDENYFDDYFVVIIYASAPQMGDEYEVNDIYCYGSYAIYVDYTCILSSAPYNGTQQDIIEIHISREEFRDSLPEEIILNGPRITYGKMLSRQYEVFPTSSTIVDIEPEFYYGRKESPKPVENFDELDYMLTQYKSNEFTEYAESLEDNFFDEKFLLIFMAISPTQTVEYMIGSVSVNEEDHVHINATYDRSSAMDMAVQHSLIVIALDKPETEYKTYTLHMTEKNAKGDVDGNGYIEVYDYIYAKRAHFGTIKLNAYQNYRADVNNDELVNQYDYILVKRMYFGTYIAD